MPDAKNRDKEFDEEIEKSPQPIPEKKKSSKFKKYVFLLFLLIGAVAGLHMSGVIDVRPFVWGVVPKIPFVGEQLKTALDIPAVYTLTVEERRRLELQEWQTRLDAKEREAQKKLALAEAMSNDFAARTQKLQKQEDELSKSAEADKNKNDASAEEKALMDELIRTYQEVSPRRAALIVARLRDDLAVELLKKLPQDARASILSKLDPKRAATITEKLVIPEN